MSNNLCQSMLMSGGTRTSSESYESTNEQVSKTLLPRLVALSLATLPFMHVIPKVSLRVGLND